MAWEKRGEQRYYYRARWEGRRSIKTYFGRGPAALAAAREDEEKRAARAAQRYAAAIEKARELPARELVTELDSQLNIAVYSALAKAGFHRHGGQWRKRRAKPSEASKQTKRRRKTKNETLPADFAGLRQRANEGDPKAQAALKQWLDSQPEVWRKLGDLAHHAQMEFTRLVTKGDFLFSESIKRRANEMRRELAGAFPTPLEILLVERVVAAWLQVQYVEGQIALADAEIPRAKFWLQRQLQANRLLHAATKSLLLIRELLPAGPSPPRSPRAEPPPSSTATVGLLLA